MKRILFNILPVLVLLISLSCSTKNEKEVSFLTFNVWQEGTSVPNGLTKIRDVITKTNPDIVCFVEVRNYKNEDWTTKIVKSLKESGVNYHRGYVGGDVSIISKYPIKSGEIVSAYAHDGTIVKFNIDINGNIIVVAGAHLDYKNYACYLPRGYNGGEPNWDMINDGNGKPKPNANVDTILVYNLASKRDEAIADFVKSVKSENKPTILMGDFNEPSYLDWTVHTKNLYDHNEAVVPWHSTKTLSENGFTDAYRFVYPNEVVNPGFTWPSQVADKGSTSWTPLADERDRVDYIFYRGSEVTVTKAALVGPKGSYVNNKLETLNTKNDTFMASDLPWPSDHKAVFSKMVFNFSK